MKPHFTLPLVGLPFAVLLALLPAVIRASPRDEVLRLVPDEMSMCAVVTGLRDCVSDSKALAALSRMPAVQARLESAEFKKLLAIKEKVLKELEVQPGQVRDDLLGDAVVLAYRQGPPDAPEREQVLLLIHARDKQLLGRVLARINDIQKKSGELKEIRDVDHRGLRYHERVKVNGKESEFYAVHDRVLIFSNREAALKSALERGNLPAEGASSFWSAKVRELGLDTALVAIVLNPRSFDLELQAQEMAAPVGDRAFLKEFRQYWKAFDAIGLFLHTADSLELGLAVRLNKEALPAAGRAFLSAFAKPSSLWPAIPDDALFGLALRSDLRSLAEMAGRFAADDQAAVAQSAIEESLRPFLPDKFKLNGLLKGLGPDWALWATSSPVSDKSWLPHITLAVKVQPTPDGEAAEATVRNAVQFLTTVAQFSSKDGLRVTSLLDGKVEIKSLEYDNLFPPGFSPSFAIKEGHLLFAGSPESIRQFKAPAPLAAGDETPILRLSSAGWTRYLGKHKAALSNFIGKAIALPPRDVSAAIDGILPNLAAIDRFEVVVRGRDNLATLTLRLKMVTGKK